jgi:acyl-CoA reductase-like NAD-dependent aldehyde dehydrogenase
MNFVNDYFPTKMLIDGKWVEGDGKEKAEVINPANNETLFSLRPASKTQLEEAVEAANKAFYSKEWSKMDGVDRGRYILKISEMIEKNAEKLATLEALETGKTISECKNEVIMTVRHFQFFAGLAGKINGESIPEPYRVTYTLREPFGVIGQIVPWNTTLKLMARGLAGALACGNTMVVKPSIVAPATLLEFGKAVQEAGLPKGVVNIIAGAGSTIGKDLVCHPKVRKIVFTGGTEGGVQVLRQAADTVTPCCLELGGKGPIIITKEADVDEAVEGVLTQAFARKGEVCFAGTRAIVDSKIHDEFVDKLVKRAEKIKLADTMDETSEMGPLISSEHLQEVLDYIDEGKKEGAKVVTGGKKPSDLELQKGNYILPTVLTEVTQDMKVAQEEIFGPVLCVMRYNEVKEAVRDANDTKYGLAAYIWCNDVRISHNIADELETGIVFINSYGYSSEIPFGGYKMSGIGREHGWEAIREYTQMKSVVIGLTEFKPKLEFGKSK